MGNNWNRSVKRVSAIDKVGVGTERVVKLDTDWEWKERERGREKREGGRREREGGERGREEERGRKREREREGGREREEEIGCENVEKGINIHHVHIYLRNCPGPSYIS